MLGRNKGRKKRQKMIIQRAGEKAKEEKSKGEREGECRDIRRWLYGEISKAWKIWFSTGYCREFPLNISR